jgi:hypothetical protein
VLEYNKESMLQSKTTKKNSGGIVEMNVKNCEIGSEMKKDKVLDLRDNA